MKIKRATIDDFKTTAKAGNDVDGFVIAKSFVGEIKPVDGEDRVREFIASTGDIDRQNDFVDPEGWDLVNFAKSGVFLWAHDSSLPPIATPLATFVQDGSLRSRVKFAPQDMDHPLGMGFGSTVMRMYDEGLLKGVSVGFRPLEWTFNSERGVMAMDVKRQELFEISAVPIPANPYALLQARSKGIDIAPLVMWAEKALDSSAGLWIQKDAAEQILDQATSSDVYEVRTDIKKGVIAYKKTPLADAESEWDAGSEVASADVEDLKVMCTWVDSEDTDVKGSYKLPHHKSDADHTCVWSGVAAAMGALLGARGGVDIPDDDRKGVYNHLAKHYEEFEKDVPEFKSVDEDVQTKIDTACEEAKIVSEIKAGISRLSSGGIIGKDNKESVKGIIATLSKMLGEQLNTPVKNEPVQQSEPPVTVEQLRTMVREAVAKGLSKLTGRLPE